MGQLISVSQEKKQHFQRRLKALHNERQSWESEWKDLSRHFMPRRSRFLASGERTNQGDRRNHLEDGIGILARRTLSAGMQSGLTSPSRDWFSLALQEAQLGEGQGAKMWLHYVYEQIKNVFSRSNFYDQIHLLYDEMIVFGTGAMLLEDDPVSTIRCRTLTAGEYCLDTDASGRVNTLYRGVRMTARQIADTWPETCPQNIRDRAKRDDETWLTVMQAIEPNPDYREGSLNARHRKFLSVYFTESWDVLEESGYFEFPVLCPRWDTTASDVYGSSPAMDALGDCRYLQKITRDGRIALELEVRPPLVASGLSRIADLSPGAVNFVSSLEQGRVGIQPMYQTRSNFSDLEREKEQVKRQIRELFFNDLFLMITQTNRQMTATEVAERNSEKMLLLGPVLERLRSELFQPLIERVFGILDRLGQIPPAPPELDGQEIKIEFISILALAQKQAGKAGIVETMSFVGQAAELMQDPGVLDKLNIDEAIDEIAAMNGVPPAMLRSTEEVAQLREERRQQIQMAQGMAAAREGADIAATGAKAVSEAGGLDPAMLAQFMGGQGGQGGLSAPM